MMVVYPQWDGPTTHHVSASIFLVVHVGVCNHPVLCSSALINTLSIIPLLATAGIALLSCWPTMCSSIPKAMNNTLLNSACPTRCIMHDVHDTHDKHESTPTCHAVEYATTRLASTQLQAMIEYDATPHAHSHST